MKTITFGSEEKKQRSIKDHQEDVEMTMEEIADAKSDIKTEREQLKVLTQCYQLLKKSKLFINNGVLDNAWDDVRLCKDNIKLFQKRVEEEKIELRITKENLKAVKKADVNGLG